MHKSETHFTKKKLI